MPSKGAIEFAEFVRVLESEATGLHERAVVSEAVRISRLARRLDRLAVAYCNRPLTDREIGERANTEATLKAIGNTYKLKFSTSGDPRGQVVTMATPKTGRYNTWGGAEAGWGIPV